MHSGVLAQRTFGTLRHAVQHHAVPLGIHARSSMPPVGEAHHEIAHRLGQHRLRGQAVEVGRCDRIALPPHLRRRTPDRSRNWRGVAILVRKYVDHVRAPGLRLPPGRQGEAANRCNSNFQHRVLFISIRFTSRVAPSRHVKIKAVFFRPRVRSGTPAIVYGLPAAGSRPPAATLPRIVDPLAGVDAPLSAPAVGIEHLVARPLVETQVGVRSAHRQPFAIPPIITEGSETLSSGLALRAVPFAAGGWASSRRFACASDQMACTGLFGVHCRRRRAASVPQVGRRP